MIKIAFIIAMGVAGFTEWLKKLLPAKVKENDVVMALIAAVIAAAAGFGATYIVPGDVFYKASIVLRLIFAGGVVAFTQTSYTLLFQTFKAVKAALTKKVSVDPDTLAEEIADKIVEEADKITKK